MVERVEKLAPLTNFDAPALTVSLAWSVNWTDAKGTARTMENAIFTQSKDPLAAVRITTAETIAKSTIFALTATVRTA